MKTGQKKDEMENKVKASSWWRRLGSLYSKTSPLLSRFDWPSYFWVKPCLNILLKIQLGTHWNLCRTTCIFWTTASKIAYASIRNISAFKAYICWSDSVLAFKGFNCLNLPFLWSLLFSWLYFRCILCMFLYVLVIYS